MHSKSYIQINRDTIWSFTELSSNTIELPLIARSLSRLVRYTGHGDKVVTIAEHSINVAVLMPAPYQIYGLMHDAAEALIGDINHPFKSRFPAISEAEDQILDHIYKQLGLWPVPEEAARQVALFDRISLGLEAKEIFGAWTWDEWSSLQGVRDLLPKYQLAIKPEALSRRVLETVWLDHFKPYMAIHVQHHLGAIGGGK
jgi:hypothetical protein